MLKVLSIVDKENTALDRLAQGLKPYHQNLDYEVIAVHPKRPDANQLEQFERLGQEADILQFDYFRTAEMLQEKYSWVKDKRKLLTHYNPYSVTESNWDNYDQVVGCNKEIYHKLQKIMHNPAERLTYIPITVDTDFWTFNSDWTPNKNVLMVANRIEGKKGILDAAVAAGNLGLNFLLVGSISDRNYFESILQSGNVRYYEQITDEQLRELYYQSTVLICNSVDNFESGTMPILEAMLCGTPVLTRNIGHVPDIYNGENMVLQDSDPEDVENIMRLLEKMLADPKALENQRNAAWNSAKNHSNERRAFEYQKLYRKLLPEPPVSVIVPIYQNQDVIRVCLNAVAEQDYANIELIVCDDSDGKENEQLVKTFASMVSFPVRYIYTGQSDYGLARARNEGAIYATGEILVFCDQRQIMQPDAVTEFVKNIAPMQWLYGSKDKSKKEFVENFSAIYKTDFMKFGGFDERMDCYGGLSQETRSRAKLQGFRLQYIETAKANSMGKSSNKYTKRQEIIRAKNRLWMKGL